MNSRSLMDYPLLTVIIPVAAHENPDDALLALKVCNYPLERLEIIVVRGNQPSRQRNQAASLAQGEILYFLDNDSRIGPDSFQIAVQTYHDYQVDALGGPALKVPTLKLFPRAAHIVFSSIFGVFSVAYRWKSEGNKPREANEKMLSSCNLSVRKEVFLKIGGFHEDFYPHEDNELVNHLQKNGYRVWYHPKSTIQKSQRPTLQAFARQVIRDAIGRIRHYHHFPHYFDVICLIPLFFCIYLLCLPWLTSPIWFLPLALYLGLDLIFALKGAYKEKSSKIFGLLLLLYPFTHITYAIGLLKGIYAILWQKNKKQEDFWLQIEQVRLQNLRKVS